MLRQEVHAEDRESVLWTQSPCWEQGGEFVLGTGSPCWEPVGKGVLSDGQGDCLSAI